MTSRLVVGTSGILAFGLLAGLSNLAVAQHTPDPYNIVGEYNRQYVPYMYANSPISGGPGATPGRDGLRGANDFQGYLDSMEEESDELSRSSYAKGGAGVPYYRANRQFDREFQRNYRPNGTADKTYLANQQQRNDKYFKALRETDPKKRAQLLREYNLENLRVSRSLSANRNISPKDREKELNRDRFNAAGLPMNPDDGDDSDPLVPAVQPLATPRRTTLPATGAPSLTAPRTGTVVAPTRVPSRPAPRRALESAPTAPGSRLTPAPPARAPKPASTPSEILERSESLNRGSTDPTPDATAPPRPPGF